VIDRQELLSALELRYVGQVRMEANEAAAMRETLADEILALEGGGDRDATAQRQEQQGDQLEHQARGEGRQAEEAGGGHRDAQGGQGSGPVTDSGTLFPEI